MLTCMQPNHAQRTHVAHKVGQRSMRTDCVRSVWHAVYMHTRKLLRYRNKTTPETSAHSTHRGSDVGKRAAGLRLAQTHGACDGEISDGAISDGAILEAMGEYNGKSDTTTTDHEHNHISVLTKATAPDTTRQRKQQMHVPACTFFSSGDAQYKHTHKAALKHGRHKCRDLLLRAVCRQQVGRSMSQHKVG